MSRPLTFSPDVGGEQQGWRARCCSWLRLLQELSLVSAHNAHGANIFQDSGATCIFLMRLMIVSSAGLLKMLV